MHRLPQSARHIRGDVATQVMLDCGLAPIFETVPTAGFRKDAETLKATTMLPPNTPAAPFRSDDTAPLKTKKLGLWTMRTRL